MAIDYSKQRKEAQAAGECPEWFTTAGYQMFMSRYSWQGESVKSRYRAIAKAMAQHAPKRYPAWWYKDAYTYGKDWEEVFFNTLWDGFISPSTPLLGNGGIRKRGTTVSCAGGDLGGNLYDRYNIVTEAAILTKHSHGTSYCVDNWPAYGDPLPRGGRSEGLIPVVRDLVQCMNEVVQGHRRGSLAYSLRPQHGDFEKVLEFLEQDTESNNVGWLINDEFIEQAIIQKNPYFTKKFAQMLKVKMIRGKGYFTFIDKMNRHLAPAFKRAGLEVRASNLCQETVLPSNDEYTFSCVILSYNLELYRSWPKHLVFIGQVMSDCNISEYIETMDEMSIQDQRAMAKIRKFTEDFRALGSGVLGFHTLLQMESIIVGSLESFFLNDEIFSDISKQAEEANGWLSKELGEPPGCIGLGIRNATMLMMPPTKSTAEIMAGASEGIGLDVAMGFTKQSSAGEFYRINKVLLRLAKSRKVDIEELRKTLSQSRGSVQNASLFPWMTDHERAVFRTGFEIPMDAHIELCAQRQQYIDQGQSINLYLTSNDSEEYIAAIHRMAFLHPGILSLYYIYSMRGAGDIVRVQECETCQ
jgi:ribonucleoside-diphosphate reductase alpha chain